MNWWNIGTYRDGGVLTVVSVGWMSFRDLRDFPPGSVYLACRTGIPMAWT